MKKAKTKKGAKRNRQNEKVREYAKGGDDKQEYIVKNCREMLDVCPGLPGADMLAAIELAHSKKSRSDRIL